MGPDGAVVLPLARHLRVPLVVTFHGYDATMTDDALRRGPLGRIYVRRRASLVREARLFIAVSDFIRGELLERGYPEERVVVHRIGVDAELFRAEATVAREPIVLFVGRLAEKKGVTHLISAMRSVQARNPDAELVLIGGGPLRPQLAQQVQDQGVRARFLGRLSPAEVRDWMSRAHLLCVPSVRAANGDAEGLPIVLLEAMAMGLPVVGARSAGIPEAVVHGATGVLVPSGDAGALAEGIAMLLTDTAAWRRMSAAGVQHVREHFDLRRQTAELEALYDRVRGAILTTPA
jgi:glycosyltransferase involved in cell wall biosynthesis